MAGTLLVVRLTWCSFSFIALSLAVVPVAGANSRMSGGATQAVFFRNQGSDSQSAQADSNVSALRHRGHEVRVRWRVSRRPEREIHPQPRLSRGPVVLAAAMRATGFEPNVRKGPETDFVSFNSHGKIQPRS